MLAQVPLFIWPMALTIGAERLSYKKRGKGMYAWMGSRSIYASTIHYEPPSWLSDGPHDTAHPRGLRVWTQERQETQSHYSYPQKECGYHI